MARRYNPGCSLGGHAPVSRACQTRRGATATLEFHAPARGLLVATCHLTGAARQALRPVLSGHQKRARISTVADITDEAHALVCRGTFEWSVRRP